MKEKLARVVITRAFVGICHMQVCVQADATDEEILAVCNRKNPSGTRNGWTEVIRKNGERGSLNEKMAPVKCGDYPSRLHIMVSC